MTKRATIIVLGAVLATGLAGGAWGESHQDAPQSDNEGSIKSDLVNEKAIRALYGRFTAAWNAHEAETMGGMWALDGDHIEPDGRHAKGREELVSLLTTQHESVFKDTTLKLTIEDVWFVSETVALVDGKYHISGIRGPEGQDIPPRAGHLTSVLLKERGNWWIAASRLMIPAPLPYRKS